MISLRRTCAAFTLFVLAACDGGGSGAVHAKPPARVPAEHNWVFYQHDQGGDLAEAEALAAKGFQVIATQREPGADLDYRAVALKEQVRELMARGVPMANLALVGRGEGGRLAMMVSGLAQVPDSALVVAAACPVEGNVEREAYKRLLRLHAPTIKGRFLSLVDPGEDGLGSCREAQETANGAESWEADLSASKDWLDEAARWIRGE